ncbi:MAG TPA: PQQ-binding-like beta-propeller repeat protein, partial [Bacteroidales bacterium]|nr:PQQ-binding-like beta-propeller repeat protein [Bacteroidales bacterium]
MSNLGKLERKRNEGIVKQASMLLDVTQKLIMKAEERNPSFMPMFRGNYSRTGIAKTKSINQYPKVLYTFHELAGVYASPVMAEGKVYFGSDSHSFFCLDAQDGSLIWQFKTGREIRSTAAINDGLLWFGSFDHHVYCLNANNGRMKWSFETKDWVFSSPAVLNGILYISGIDGNIYALDAYSGKLKWNYETEGWVVASPAFTNGKLIVGSRDGWIYALDIHSGSLLWKTR